MRVSEEFIILSESSECIANDVHLSLTKLGTLKNANGTNDVKNTGSKYQKGGVHEL
jgi:hypothetical protein